MVSLQSILWVFLLNNFSRVINLLLTKLARDRTGRISALGLFCTDLASFGPYCQDLGPIFSQYGPRAWLIRYVYYMASSVSGQDEPNRAASFFFCEFMDLDFVSVHKHAKKELGQYPAILTSRLVNNPYVYVLKEDTWNLLSMNYARSNSTKRDKSMISCLLYLLLAL